MQSKLSVFATKVAESGWLAALLVVPLLFNLYTERIFEEDKIPLLRSISLVVFLALIVLVVERGRETLQVDDRPVWKLPVVPFALLLAVAYLISTVASVVPDISFWGAYIRRQGTYTWLSYLVVFFAILFLLRDRKQVERLITLVLLTSVPASLYAFLQNRGLDPVPWGGDVIQRVSSTAGNPIFISAFLIMIFPVTLMRVMEHFQQLLRAGASGGRQSYLASSLLAGGYLFLLIIQAITIVFSQSRGPLLGLGMGLVFFTLLTSLRYNRWLTLTFTGLTVAGILFLITFNLPNSPLAPLRDAPYIGRLGRVFETESGTGRVRVLIWQGVTELLKDNPARTLIGYGPEAMYVAYTPYYPPELGQVEQRNASPDRSHNETFDSIVMTGILGFASQSALFLSIIFYALRWLGLIDSKRQRNSFLATVVLGGFLGLILPYFLTGTFIMSGVGLPVGIGVGLIVYLLLYALSHLKAPTASPHPHHLLLITLLSAVIGHYMEIHLGIAIGATRLYFWIFTGMIIVLGLSLVPPTEPAVAAVEEGAESRGRRRGRRRGRAAALPPLLSGSLVGLSLMMGLILAVLTFNFYVPNVGLDMSDVMFPLIWLFVGTWLFGALAVSAESAVEQGEGSRWLPRLGAYTLISVGSWLAFALFYIPWASARPTVAGGTLTIDDLMSFASQVANNITLLYIFTFLIITVTAFALLWEQALPRLFARPPHWQVAGYGVLLALVVPTIVLTNLNISRADVFSKQGSGYERNQNWDAAQLLYEEALRLQPDEDRYFLNLGRALMEKARTVRDDPVARDRYMQEALDVLERARRTNPLNTDHSRNLANLHRAWAAMLSESEEQARHRSLAVEYYQDALALSPNNAALWNEAATLSIERGEYELAREQLEHSLGLDDSFVQTYLIFGNLEIEQENYEAAVEIYDRAVQQAPNHLAALSGKALALSRLNRLEEAIAVNERALEIAPNDYTTLKNLALLYRDHGDTALALESAQAALVVATPEERPALEAFIQQLQQ